MEKHCSIVESVKKYGVEPLIDYPGKVPCGRTDAASSSSCSAAPAASNDPLPKSNAVARFRKIQAEKKDKISAGERGPTISI